MWRILFAEDVTDIKIIVDELQRLSQLLFTRITRYELYGRTVTLKIKYYDFKIISRSKTFSGKVTSADEIIKAVETLLLQTEAGTKKIRLVGVGVSGFDEEKNNGQLELF